MNRQEIIQRHLNNTFVYKRRYWPPVSPIPVERVDAFSKEERDKKYYADVLRLIREQLEKVPEDILLASESTILPDGTPREPMAIIVIESDEDAHISLAESAVILNINTLHPARGFFLTSAIAEHDLRPEWAVRMGALMLAYCASIPSQRPQSFAPEVIAERYCRGNTLVHEFGHYYLHCILTRDKREEFLTALTESVTRDVAMDATAISPCLIRYVQDRKQSHPDLDSREEYFSYLIQQLSGGRSKFTAYEDGKMFELKKCPHLLNCVLHYHPGWIGMIKSQVPSFEAAGNTPSWRQDVRAENRGRAPWE